MPARPDASTKRPLLEDEDGDPRLPPLTGGASSASTAGRARGDEYHSLLSDGGGEGASPTPVAESPAPLPAAPPASGSSVASGGVRLASRAPPPDRRTREPRSPRGAVELRQYSPPALQGGGGAGLQDCLEEDVPLSPSPEPAGERHCFICLDGDKDQPLVRCCSTCYACTHTRCWRDWRNSQRLTALRSRLLGVRMQNNNLLRCTICKSGTAVLAGEEGGLQWMNDLLCGGGGEASRPAPPRPTLGHDSDENDDLQLDDLVDLRTCIALMVYLGILVVVLVVACVLIVTQKFYAGDVVLCCIIALYELSVLQVVVLAVARRRAGMLASAAQQEAMEGGDSETPSIDLELQLQARDVPLPRRF